MATQEDHKSASGRFELTKLIEEGVSGKLYQGRDTEQNTGVLIKLVAKSLSDDPRFCRYLDDRRAEQDVLSEHPNIAQVVAIGKRGEQYYVAVEAPDGERLSEKLKKAPLDPGEVLEIMHQMAEALRAAHRRDIVHGHLKPSDVFVTREPTGRLLVKLSFVDLGVGASDSILPLFGEVYGVPKYMAPEVIKGSVPGPQSDLFSLGVIGYELLTGTEPFPSEHPVGYLFANCEKDLVPANEARQEAPRELSTVVSRCLEKEPERRYGSAQSLIDDLDKCLKSIKTAQVRAVPMGVGPASAREYEVPAPDTATARVRARAPRGWPLAIVGGVVGIGVGVLGGLLLLPHFAAAPSKSVGDSGTAPPLQVSPASQTGSQDGAPGRGAAAQTEAAARLAYEKAQTDWNRYIQSRDYGLAVAASKGMAADYPDSTYAPLAQEMASQAYCEWARSLAAENKLDEAISTYREAIKVAPQGKDSEYVQTAYRELPKVMAQAADYCYQSGDYDKALQMYRDIHDNHPGSVEAGLLAKWEPTLYYEQAYDLWKHKGNYDEALNKFQYVLRTSPDSEAAGKCRSKLPALYLDIASDKIKRGESEAALEDLSKIQSAFPDTAAGKQAAQMHAELLYKLYAGASKEGRSEDAARYLGILSDDHPGSEWMREARRHELGLVPEQAGQMLDPVTARSSYEQAESLAEGLKYKAAVEMLKAVLRGTASSSEVNAGAWEKLPEWTYLDALNEYGLNDAKDCEAMLLGLDKDFPHTPWAKRGAETLRRIENPPPGMAYVPEGKFYMGSSQEEIVQLLRNYNKKPEVLEDKDALALILSWRGYNSEMPKHVASTGAFYIDKTEVTNEQYMKFVQAKGHTAPWPDGKFPEGEADKPVTNVTFDDAAAYAKWAGKRLPTEIEWEKAARGVDGRLYPWGDVWQASRAQHLLDQDAGSATVGLFPQGASPYGCLDMIGNVMEWTNSWFEAYPGNDREPGQTPYGTQYRVQRGAAWYVYDLDSMPARCSTRFPATPDSKTSDAGFRCVQDAE